MPLHIILIRTVHYCWWAECAHPISCCEWSPGHLLQMCHHFKQNRHFTSIPVFLILLYFRTWIKFTIFAYLRTFQINKLTCAFCEVPWLFLQVLQFDWVRSEILLSSLLSFSIPPDQSLQVLIGPSTNRARHAWRKNMATWKISIVEELLHHLSITQLRRE